MATLNVWYNFSKKKNSTKQPTGTADLSLDVKLKEETSLANPHFIVTGDRFTANYAQYGGMYYFIDDIISLHNGLCEIVCSKDVLATYKANIQAASAYVLYYSHSNTEIVDHRLSTKTSITTDSSTETFNNLGTGESYMLTVIASDSIGSMSGDGGTTVFACDQNDVNALFTDQLLSTLKTDFDDAISDVQDAIDAITGGDPFDALIGLAKINYDWMSTGQDIADTVLYCDDVQKFVKHCYVLPVAPVNIGGSTKQIKVGKWESNSSGRKGFPRILHDSATVNIPWQANDWRRNAPYHQIYLYIPYIGLVEIPASEVIGVSTITVNVSIDTYSGVSTFVVNAANGTVLGQYSTNIAAQYAVGSSNISLVQAGANIIASSAAIAAGAITGSVPAALGGALGLANAIKPLDSSIGSNSGAAGMGLGNTVKCFTVFHDTTVSPGSVSAVAGTPYNGVMSLSGVSGYVQTANASVDLPGFGTDKDTVNSFLNGGIYIE